MSKCVWCGQSFSGKGEQAFGKDFCGVRCRDEYVAKYGDAEIKKAKKDKKMGCILWVLIILGILVYAIFSGDKKDSTASTSAETSAVSGVNGKPDFNSMSPEENIEYKKRLIEEIDANKTISND